jgi:hypothetical protein
MKFKMREQQRREVPDTSVSFVAQCQIVKLLCLGKRLRFGDGRCKLRP